MNANRASSVALALALGAAGSVHAEIGVAIQQNPASPRIIYVFDDLTEDPTPITQIWRRLSASDPARVVLNPEGELNGDGAPSLLSDPATGLIAAAWARSSASGYDVVVSQFTGGAWAAAQVVAGSPAQELDPHLVLDPDGSIHLFYWVDGATRQVFEVTAPPDLSSWSTPVLVSQPGESACRPAGAFYNGVLYVAYEVHNFGNGNSPRQVVLARFDNGVFTPEVIAVTNNLNDVYPQVHSHAGRLWVDWVDTEAADGSGEIAWTRMNAQGQWEPIHYDGFANREQRDYSVRSGVRVEVIQ